MFDLQRLKARAAPPLVDPALPPCPLCGAAAFASAYRHPLDLEHNCNCIVRQEAAYYRGLERLWRIRRCEERLAASLPARYRAYTLDAYQHSGHAQAIQAALRLAPGQWLYLWGPPGRGKTHLAVGTARRLAAQGHSALFLSELGYFEELYRSFRNNTDPPKYDHVEVLVLDDFGKAKPSETTYQWLYALVEHFYSENKTLIITSNYPPDQAARRLAGGELEAASAMASRLAHSMVVGVGGEDRRKTSAAA